MSDIPQITIEPHPAKKYVHGTPVQHIHDVKQIMVHEPGRPTPIRIGYCGAVPGRPITFIRRYPESYKELVKAEVERILAGPVSGMFEPPPEPQPEEVDDEDTEQEDEE